MRACVREKKHARWSANPESDIAGAKKQEKPERKHAAPQVVYPSQGRKAEKPGEAAGADSAGRGQRLGSDYLDMKGMEEVEEEVKSLLGNGVHVMSL